MHSLHWAMLCSRRTTIRQSLVIVTTCLRRAWDQRKSGHSCCVRRHADRLVNGSRLSTLRMSVVAIEWTTPSSVLVINLVNLADRVITCRSVPAGKVGQDIHRSCQMTNGHLEATSCWQKRWYTWATWELPPAQFSKGLDAWFAISQAGSSMVWLSDEWAEMFYGSWNAQCFYLTWKPSDLLGSKLGFWKTQQELSYYLAWHALLLQCLYFSRLHRWQCIAGPQGVVMW